MSHITITNNNDADGPAVEVVTQTILEGGRELRANGTARIQPGKSKDFLLDEDQSVRVTDIAPE